jgi:hypothetical protein
MTQESATVLPSSNNSLGQKLGGGALLVIALVLFYSLQLDPVLQAPKLAPVVVSLFAVCAMGGGAFILGAPENQSFPVRLLQAAFIISVFAFLGTLGYWMFSVG